MQTLTLAKKKAKEIIRGLIPANVLKDRYIYRRLGKRAGRKYLQLRALDMAGFKSQNAIASQSTQSHLSSFVLATSCAVLWRSFSYCAR